MRYTIRHAESRDFLAVWPLLPELGRGELNSASEPIFRERYACHIGRADTASLVAEEDGPGSRSPIDGVSRAVESAKPRGLDSRPDRDRTEPWPWVGTRIIACRSLKLPNSMAATVYRWRQDTIAGLITNSIWQWECGNKAASSMLNSEGRNPE